MILIARGGGGYPYYLSITLRVTTRNFTHFICDTGANMPLYPVTIRRCQHIKVNGTQCGSPARRDEPCCHFHLRWRTIATNVKLNPGEQGTILLPTLQDPTPIQALLGEMCRLLAANPTDPKAAALILYAVETAPSNVRYTSFDPEPTRVIIDRES